MKPKTVFFLTVDVLILRMQPHWIQIYRQKTCQHDL